MRPKAGPIRSVGELIDVSELVVSGFGNRCAAENSGADGHALSDEGADGLVVDGCRLFDRPLHGIAEPDVNAPEVDALAVSRPCPVRTVASLSFRVKCRCRGAIRKVRLGTVAGKAGTFSPTFRCRWYDAVGV